MSGLRHYGVRWQSGARSAQRRHRFEQFAPATSQKTRDKTKDQAIAHNLMRALMLEAAMSHGVEPERLSFKGTVDMMRAWAGWMHHDKPRINKELMRQLLLAIATEQVPLCPCRSEPRSQKRRPKGYPYLNKPRHEMAAALSRRKR